MYDQDRSVPPPGDQPTLGRAVAAARTLSFGVWAVGLSALIADSVTGSAAWHVVGLAAYFAIVPIGVVLSTVLRHRQRDLDRAWAQRLTDLAIRDELTGLFNRRHFNTQLERFASECLRAGTPLSLAFVDLNDFKAINDTHGHEAGDAALRSVAHCLVELVGDRGIVARTGGDEFGIVLPGMSEANAQALFGPACRTMPVLLPWSPEGSEMATVSGTVGIASLDGSGDIGELLRSADIRLYENKRARDGERRVA